MVREMQMWDLSGALGEGKVVVLAAEPAPGGRGNAQDAGVRGGRGKCRRGFSG